MSNDIYRERARQAREWFYGQPVEAVYSSRREWRPPPRVRVALWRQVQRLLRTKLSGPVPDRVYIDRTDRCSGCEHVQKVTTSTGLFVMLCGRCGCPAEMFAALNDIVADGKVVFGKNRRDGHRCPVGKFGPWQPWWRTAWVLLREPAIAAQALREIGGICLARLRSRGWVERPSKVVQKFFAVG